MTNKKDDESQEKVFLNIREALAAPFDFSDIEFRPQQSGFAQNGKPWALILAYVQNRAIQERLDSVVGIDNWKNEFCVGPQGGVLCGLSVQFPANLTSGDWVTKWDGAENTDIEPVKGGLSDSMKRAAVQWGIGRYLYKLPSMFATFCDKEESTHMIKLTKRNKDGKEEKKKYYWKAPPLPPEFLLENDSVYAESVKYWKEKNFIDKHNQTTKKQLNGFKEKEKTEDMEREEEKEKMTKEERMKSKPKEKDLEELESEMLFHMNTHEIEDWINFKTKSADGKYKGIFSVNQIKSYRQFYKIRTMLRDEYGPPPQDLIPEQDISEVY